jgi:O-antigen/teichoic acid export membrane protein
LFVFKKILSGSKENLKDRICTLLIRFSEPIIFLSFFSIEGYGEWLILITFPYYLAISELGFGDVISNEINMLKERKKIMYCKYLFQNLIKFVIFISLIFFLVFFLIFYNFDIFNFKTIKSEDLYKILIILGIYTVISQINGIFIKFLSINNQYNLSVKISYYNKIAELIFISFALLVYKNLYEVSLSILITKIIFLIVTFICVEKYIEWFDLKKIREFKLSISKKFLKKYTIRSLLYSSMPIGQILKLQLTTLIIGITLGPAMLVISNIYLIMARMPIQIANIADGIIKIELAKLYIQKKTQIFKKYYITNVYSVFFIGTGYFILMSFFGEFFLKIWLNEKIPFYKEIFIFFLLYGLIYSTSISIVNPLFSTNNFKKISLIFLTNSILFVISLKFFSQSLGLIFVSINFVFFEIIYLLYCYFSSKKAFGLEFKDFKLDLTFLRKIFRFLYLKIKK